MSSAKTLPLSAKAKASTGSPRNLKALHHPRKPSVFVKPSLLCWTKESVVDFAFAAVSSASVIRGKADSMDKTARRTSRTRRRSRRFSLLGSGLLSGKLVSGGVLRGGVLGLGLLGLLGMAGCAQHARLREENGLPAMAAYCEPPHAATAASAVSAHRASPSPPPAANEPTPAWIDTVPTSPTPASSRTASFQVAKPSLEMSQEEATSSIPVSLVAVLESVDRDNPLVIAARHRVEEAYASWSRAEALWLPSLRAGANYNKHDGRIQDVVGGNIDTNRNAVYGGFGASAVGAGSPAIPGLYANVHTADAWFQPKIASQTAAARQAGAESAANNMLLEAALAYGELLRAEQERAAWRELTAHAERLAELTESYAKTGQGLAADSDRASTELALRRNEALRATEASRVASARLAQLMRLDPTLPLEPQEPGLAAFHLVSADEPPSQLIATALMTRPEVRENQALVAEAVGKLQRERWAPLMPSVLLGVSQGGFGAGLNGDFDHFGGRLDADVAAWWEVRNLGLGERAARNESRSKLQQAKWREIAMMDQIAREVVEARTRVVSRREQLEIARRAVEVAESSRRKNLDRIENGEGLPLECLQSLQALAQAQREHIRVIADYNAAQFSLLWAVGSLRDTGHAHIPSP
jgi:outer membrane protein TolC